MNHTFAFLLGLVLAASSSASTLTWSRPSFYEMDALYANPANYKASNIFVTYGATNFSTTNFTRNTNCWAYPIDMTPLLVGRKALAGDTFAMNCGSILISPQHIASAQHCAPTVGYYVLFISSNNAPEVRYITNTSNPSYEINIGQLNAPITNCGFARFLDYGTMSNLLIRSRNYVGVANRSVAKTIPMFTDNQYGSAFVQQLLFLGEANNVIWGWERSGSSTNLTFGAYPTATNRHHFLPAGAQYPAFGITSGDSGHPLCLVLENKLVLVSTYTGAGSGYNFAASRNLMDNAMSAWGSAYRTTTVSRQPIWTPDLYPVP